MLRIHTLAIAAAVMCFLPAAAAADDIVATGHHPGRTLDIAGPDAVGHYTLRVNIADINAASPVGWQVMAERVHMGTALLCDAAAPQPYAGFFYREQRECLSESGVMASAQMAEARDRARAGTPVAMIDLRR